MTACCVFPLIFVGAGVTSKDAGMVFPDWPTSDGHVINPPNWWQGDHTRWEHGHRLIGWTVGMLSCVLVAVTWSYGGWARRAGIATLLAIIAQGVMGGIRVREISTTWAMLHGIWGQVCFCLACIAALITSAGWVQRNPTRFSKYASFSRRLSVLLVVSVFVQLVLGAMVRHFHWNAALVGHLLGVIVVAFVVGWATLWIMAQHAEEQLLVRLVQIIAVLLSIQIVLGAFTFVVTFMPSYSASVFVWLVPSLHVGMGALLLAGSMVLVIAVYHRLVPCTPAETAHARGLDLVTS